MSTEGLHNGRQEGRFWAVRIRRGDGTYFLASGTEAAVALFFTRPGAVELAKELEADGVGPCDIVCVKCAFQQISKPNRLKMGAPFTGGPTRYRLNRPVIGPSAAANMPPPFTNDGGLRREGAAGGQ